MILKGVGGLYTVKTENGEIPCRARGALRKLDPPPAPGDRVTVDKGVILEICERRNILIRPFLANLDRLFIITALAEPDPDDYFIDKLTVIAEHAGIEPVLVFNKCDLPDKFDLVANYSRLPYRKFRVSSVTGEGVKELSSAFSGKVSALAGLSGAGKSSILNSLSRIDGGEGLSAVGDLSERLARGKHTTRHTELFPLCGGWIADTPGFGSIEPEYFGLYDRSLLINCFPDLAEHAEGCRFTDCRHRKEKGCRLRLAAEEGQVSSRRYASYLRMYEEMGEYKPWEKKQL